MRFIISLILIILCASCAKKEVQLPQTTNKDIIDILDVSPIYMFYNEENDSIEFNRKNMISTTNWLVNIDKRLTLKQILPHLQYLQEKRHGDGMHKNENARNYFTCHNTNIENLSFIEFTETEFLKIQKDIILDSSRTSQINSTYLKNTNKLETSGGISIGTKLDMFYDSNDTFYLYQRKVSTEYIKEYIKDLNTKASHINYYSVSLYFNENITFQDYISFKSFLLEQDNKKIVLSKEEVIYK